MTEDRRIRRIVIVGGGTAGWAAAALLGRVFSKAPEVSITLVESADVPTVGVGEATIPPILEFLQLVGVDMAEFVRRTEATFKLGIRFEDWREPGHGFWHPFGGFGVGIERRPFQNVWQRLQAEGEALDLADYSPTASLSRAGRFAPPATDGSYPGANIAFALHFDAGLVAAYLREVAEALGVERLQRTLVGAEQDDRGHIRELVFDGGERLGGDLFIDCSGFRGVLIEGVLKAGYEDWTHWLPCDRAVAAPTARIGAAAPYTLSTAREAGWQWRIPLQHRTGNGYVYSSAFTDDARALDHFTAALDGAPIAEPRVLRFTTGRRRSAFVGNCLALGLSAGFLEPLESTSIQLIVTGLQRLLDSFPDRDFDPALLRAYNRETAEEYAHVRDFILFHYLPNRRAAEAFWDAVRHTPPPDSLAEKIELIAATGRAGERPGQMFNDLNWFYIAQGLGVASRAHDPLADLPDRAALDDVLRQIRTAIAAFTARAAPHDEVLAAVARGAAKRG